MMTSDYIQEDQEAISLKTFGAADVIINPHPLGQPSSFSTNFSSELSATSSHIDFHSSTTSPNLTSASVDLQTCFAPPNTTHSFMASGLTASQEPSAMLPVSGHYFSSMDYPTSCIDAMDYGTSASMEFPSSISTSTEFPLATTVDFSGSQTEFVGSPEYLPLSLVPFTITAPFECLSAPPSFSAMGYPGHHLAMDYTAPIAPVWHGHYGTEQNTSISTTSMAPIKGKSPYVVLWLQSHFEPSDGVSMPRSLLYTHYYESCIADVIEPVNAASFGKIIRSVFPNLRTRRLGTRGHSKYHYYGIRMKASLSTIATTVPSSFTTVSFGSTYTTTVETTGPVPHNAKSHFTIRPAANQQPLLSASTTTTTTYSPSAGNGLSCVTANPPSIDRFAAMLHMAAPDTLPVEHGDLFRLGLQHHTTLLLSLILREEYLQFEEEFTLYWLSVFPKSFPEFQASSYANKMVQPMVEGSFPFPTLQKEEHRPSRPRLCQSVLAMVRQFDGTSLMVIQECFLASFWTKGITQTQLENVRVFCTKTLPGLMAMLSKGYFSSREFESIQFDNHGWPIGQPWYAPATLPFKLLSVKLEFFKKLSAMLLKRVSLHSLATTLRNLSGIVTTTTTTKRDTPSGERTGGGALLFNSPTTGGSPSMLGFTELCKLARAAIHETAGELQRHAAQERSHGLRAQAFGLNIMDQSLSASFSRSIDEIDTAFIPEEILAQLVTSMELIFNGDQLDWDAWTSFLDGCIDHETSDEAQEEMENCRHLDTAAKRRNGALSAIGPISYGELERMQRYLQNLLIQWSFVISVFMDQLLTTKNLKRTERSGAGDEAMLAEYLHLDQNINETTTLSGSGILSTATMMMPSQGSALPASLFSLFETIRLLTEEYLLYLVEWRLEELKDACASTTNGLISVAMEPNFFGRPPLSHRREKRSKKKTFDMSSTSASSMESMGCAFIQDFSIENASVACRSSISSS